MNNFLYAALKTQASYFIIRIKIIQYKLNMNQEDSYKDSSELVTSPPRQKPVNAIITASDDDVRSLSKIQFRLRLCHTYIEGFQNEVSNYLPFLKTKVITEASLLKFCVRMKRCTTFFVSAMFMLEEQLEICGLKFPQSFEEINSLIKSFHQDQERLTRFFRVVEHFFSPNSPYLKEKGGINELQKQNPWENVDNDQYDLQQMCQIIKSSHFQYTCLKERIEVYTFIFRKLLPTFHCKEKYILYPIIQEFKDIHCEMIGLEIYLNAITRSSTYLKEMSQNSKEKEKVQKATYKKQTYQIKSSLKGEKEGGNEKVKAQQSATKPLYLTIKQKAYGLMRTFIGSPAAFFKGKQQQPQQSQCLLKEQ